MTHSKHKIIPYSQVEFDENIDKIPNSIKKLTKRCQNLKEMREKVKYIAQSEIAKAREFTQDVETLILNKVRTGFNFIKAKSQNSNNTHDEICRELIKTEEMIELGNIALNENENPCKRVVDFSNLKQKWQPLQTRSNLQIYAKSIQV
mmetsp:Transcript_26749/g.23610  ORF Transcript_26749/g.23610 Transcript_26749/m.23610 type:complete len:148 (+) Transcript_26749:543-986(+)